jgi:hypothetical protein
MTTFATEWQVDDSAGPAEGWATAGIVAVVGFDGSEPAGPAPPTAPPDYSVAASADSGSGRWPSFLASPRRAPRRADIRSRL